MDGQFRVALSLGQNINAELEKGVHFNINGENIRDRRKLQEAYNQAGSTEMYVRIATKRYNTDHFMDEQHSRNHNLEVGLEYCRLAAELDMPINPEIMCAYTYMDGFLSQAPDFKDYPEFAKPDKLWSDHTLEEMCFVLEQYGEFIADTILRTSCRVNYWNLGNEANFGFAGLAVGLKNLINPELENKTIADLFTMEHYGADYLKNNVWNYNAKLMRALARGIIRVQPEAKFATHIACINDRYFDTAYYHTLKEHGMYLTQAGISVYPTNEMSDYLPDFYENLKYAIRAIADECGLPVFIAEYGYPSSQMTGKFGTWDVPVPGYELSEHDQARFTKDFIEWGRKNGVCGIRPWGPDILGDWTPMSFYTYDEHTNTAAAKPVMGVFR